ncbi:MAG TPA: hypothetical protein VHL34_03230 [Rhizomicrobium sp.]|nr:hypothetical protein [Rhizomicrobium sp.]
MNWAGSVRVWAWLYLALLAVLCVFQIALALGAPWGALAMGGAYPGVYPPAMRVAALVQIVVYGAMGAVVAARAGIGVVQLERASRWAIWLVVAINAIALVLNLITPSASERMLWAPVAAVMFFASLRVAMQRER